MDFVQKPPVTPADLISEFVQLRNGKKAADATYAAWLKTNFTDRMEEIQLILLDFINNNKGKNFSCDDGTAYKYVQTSVTVKDQKEFRAFVIDNKEFDLIDWRANKTGVIERIEKGGALPPGVNYSERVTVGIRKGDE